MEEPGWKISGKYVSHLKISARDPVANLSRLLSFFPRVDQERHLNSPKRIARDCVRYAARCEMTVS